jgi:Intracellular proteinase inhibitor
MNFRVTVCVVAMVALAGCSSSTGLYRWVPFMGNGKKDQPRIAKVDKENPNGRITGPVYYGLEMRVKVMPEQIRLSDTRSLEVHLQLIDRTKKSVTLMFSDSRKYDFILRDNNGRKLAQWSDDQPVNQTPGYVIINPGERVEFVGNVSTRDMVAGRTYTLLSFVVGYDRMQLATQLVPTGERVIPPTPRQRPAAQAAPAPTPTPSSLLQPAAPQ